MDLSAVQQDANIARGLSGFILATPQNSQGIAAQLSPNNISVGADVRSLTNSTTFLFHYEGENTVTLDSDITDHYVEDNSAIEDQIAVKPEIVTTQGYIGELNDVVPAVLQPLKLAADTLTTLTPYLPELSGPALIKYNQAMFNAQVAMQIANSAVQAWQTITGADVQNKQQQAFSMFYGYWSQRQLFTVNTPWGQWKDMAIKTLRAVQDEDTRMVSTFEVTFKKMRFASTTISPSNTFQGRAANQSSNTTQQGTSTLTTSKDFTPGAVA